MGKYASIYMSKCMLSFLKSNSPEGSTLIPKMLSLLHAFLWFLASDDLQNLLHVHFIVCKAILCSLAQIWLLEKFFQSQSSSEQWNVCMCKCISFQWPQYCCKRNNNKTLKDSQQWMSFSSGLYRTSAELGWVWLILAGLVHVSVVSWSWWSLLMDMGSSWMTTALEWPYSGISWGLSSVWITFHPPAGYLRRILMVMVEI